MCTSFVPVADHNHLKCHYLKFQLLITILCQYSVSTVLQRAEERSLLALPGLYALIWLLFPGPALRSSHSTLPALFGAKQKCI